MSAWEALMWRADADPRTRSTGILLELLASEPAWDRIVAAHTRVTTAIPRLRDRVVEPPVPLVQPSWSPDPAFDISNHLRAVHLKNGSRRDVLDLCESLLRSPFERTRPPWEAVVVSGLQDGSAAYLLKIHHSLSDGLGLMQLLELAHSDQSAPRPPQPVHLVPASTPRATPFGLLTSGVRSYLSSLPKGLESRARQIASVAREPAHSLSEATQFAESLARMVQPSAVQRSELLKGHGGAGNRLLTVDVPLDGLRNAAKQVGASINDAFLASVLGGIRLYHEAHGEMVERIPIGMPISLRSSDDPLGGNQFVGTRFAAPMAEKDPAARMLEIREFVLAARAEPAVAFVNILSPVLSKLPTSVIIETSAKLTATSDLQVSNIRGIGHPLYMAGARIEGMYPLGPRPGVAAMIAMITYNGRCCVGVNADPDVFDDPDELAECLRGGFAEVVAIGTVGVS
jgi:WS/DGAT/MGAT family acyltransferase